MSRINVPARLCAAVLIFVTAANTTAAGAGRKPATRPAAKAEADRSTPRAGLRALLAANEAGDRPDGTACFHFSNQKEELLADSVSLLGASQWWLRVAVALRLGEPAARDLCGHLVRAADAGQFRVEEKGDTALVSITGTSGFPMVKVDGKWLVSASAMAAQEKLQPLELAAAYLEYAKRYAVTAKAVLDGRQRSVDDIRKYLETGKPTEEASMKE